MNASKRGHSEAGETVKALSVMQGSFFLYAAWTTALAAVLGSLFFGEVMGLPICTLCWYQRMALYPLALLLPAALLLRERRINWYVMPLAVLGLAVALYHNLLYYGIVARELTPCAQDVPCTARQIEWLGFLTIPLMSLATFAMIVAFLVCFQLRSRK